MTERTLREKIATLIAEDHLQLLSDFDVDGDIYRQDPECVGSAYMMADAILRLLEAHTAEQTAPSAAPVAEPVVWSGVENAPYDTPLTVLAGGMTFAAILRRDASLNEEGESCDQWQAVVEGEHPPCWTDGACWESNEDGIPCLWPEAFMPLTKPADFRTAVKGSRT